MFNILTHFTSDYDKEAIWNCRHCVNLSHGCDKCVTKKSDHKYTTFTCRSFQYYIFHKIRCECLGTGCKYCKQQGFIIERIHNYKNHDTCYENDSEYKLFAKKYTIINEEDWNHFKCLSEFYIPPSEKERLIEDVLSTERLWRGVRLAFTEMAPLIAEKFCKNDNK